MLLLKSTRNHIPIKEQVCLIQGIPPPTTRKEFQGFLGMINYCRQWTPDYSHHDKVFCAACLASAPDIVIWDVPFSALKTALCNAPALGLPNYHLPFHLYVSENGTTTAGVLGQEHRCGFRPVGCSDHPKSHRVTTHDAMS